MCTKVCMHLQIPIMRGLFQTIQQPTHLLVLPFLNKLTRLQYINLFMQVTIQKFSLHIQLRYIPTIMSCECTNVTNRGHMASGSKILIKVNTLLLSITFCNKPSLVVINATIWILFHPVNPLGTNFIFSRRQISQVPCAILDKCIILCVHYIHPIF